MTELGKVRQLLVVMKRMAPCLTDEEISDIGKVLLRASNRMLEESGEDGNE